MDHHQSHEHNFRNATWHEKHGLLGWFFAYSMYCLYVAKLCRKTYIIDIFDYLLPSVLTDFSGGMVALPQWEKKHDFKVMYSKQHTLFKGFLRTMQPQCHCVWCKVLVHTANSMSLWCIQVVFWDHGQSGLTVAVPRDGKRTSLYSAHVNCFRLVNATVSPVPWWKLGSIQAVVFCSCTGATIW